MAGVPWHIALTGPESSGKTTLCAELAEQYATQWVPEYARHALEREGPEYTRRAYLDMAAGQKRWIDRSKKSARKWLFIDTAWVVYAVWGLERWGEIPEEIHNYFTSSPIQGFILCSPDIPWEPDPLREYPSGRERLFQRYENLLDELDLPYVIVSGDRSARKEQAVEWLRKLKK